MRITYIHQYFTTPDMAGGTRSYDFARSLTEAGHEVNVVTSAIDGRRRGGWYVTQEAGATVHWMPNRYANTMTYRERMWAFAKFVVGATLRASQLPADVVFATSTPLTVAIPAVFAARVRRVPMVFEVRDLWPAVPISMGALGNPVLRGLARFLERWAYRNAESVVALSPGMRDGVVHTGYAAERVALIPNGSDLRAFAPQRSAGHEFRRARPWLGERPLVLYAGALGRANGVTWLVDLARELRSLMPDLRVLVIGDGYDKSKLEDAARTAGLLDEVFYMESPIPKQDVPAAFAAADVSACLFIDRELLWTGSPNKLFDSLAAGTPVIVNYGGWQAELLEKRGAGIAVPTADVASAARRIVRLLGTQEELEEMGRRARGLAEELFDRKQHADQLRAVLEAARQREGSRASSLGGDWT